MATNRFVKKKLGRFTLWLEPQFVDSPLQTALADGICSLNEAYSLDKVPASKSSEVYKFACAGDTSKPVFYFKQYHCRSVWDFVKHTFRPSRAKRAMQACQMLEANGFSSPVIAAMGCRRNGPFCVENFLLTQEVENALPLYAFFEQNYGQKAADSSLSSKRDFIKAAGQFVGRLHFKNISHGDLRLGNILVGEFSFNQQPAAGNKQPNWHFVLLDNERTIQYTRLPNRLRLKNLVQVNMFQAATLTRTERLRFFKAYLSENPALIPTWKTWAKKIHDKTVWRLGKRRQTV